MFEQWRGMSSEIDFYRFIKSIETSPEAILSEGHFCLMNILGEKYILMYAKSKNIYSFLSSVPFQSLSIGLVRNFLRSFLNFIFFLSNTRT